MIIYMRFSHEEAIHHKHIASPPYSNIIQFPYQRLQNFDRYQEHIKYVIENNNVCNYVMIFRRTWYANQNSCST